MLHQAYFSEMDHLHGHMGCSVTVLLWYCIFILFIFLNNHSIKLCNFYRNCKIYYFKS